MKQYKRIIGVLSVICLMVLGSAQAQEKAQWFVGVGGTSTFDLNNSNTLMAGGRLSAGVWVNKYMAFRLNGMVGNVWLKDSYTASTIGGDLDWIVNLQKGGRNNDRRWNFNAVMGIGYNFYNFSEGYSKYYTHVSDINGTVALQITCKLSRKFLLYAEPGFAFTPKYYDFQRKDDVFASASFNAGIIINL